MYLLYIELEDMGEGRKEADGIEQPSSERWIDRQHSWAHGRRRCGGKGTGKSSVEIRAAKMSRDQVRP